MNTISQRLPSGAKKTKYDKLIGLLKEQIETGRLKAGDRLPPVRNLAYDIGAAPGTVARAYKELIKNGYLEAGVGQGTFVRRFKAAVIKSSVRTMYLRSPRLPDIGQVDILRLGFVEFANSAGFDELMAYPTRADTYDLQSAYLSYFDDVPLGYVEPDDVVITHGGQHGGVVALQTIQKLRPGGIIVEDLSYQGFKSAADLVGITVHAVGMDEHGPDPDQIHAIIAEHRIAAIFSSAEVNNPTTIRTTNERRAEIADIAREHGIHIVEDDCYRVGAYSGVSYRSLYPQRSWYISSFSKSISPALRIGCVICPSGTASMLKNTVFFNSLGVSRSNCEVAKFVLCHPKIGEIQALISEETNKYLQETVNRLGQFAIRWRENVPMLWLELPRGWRTTAFCQAAQDRGVLVSSSEVFTTRDGNAPQAVRIAVNAEYGLERYLEAIDVLADLLRHPDYVSGV